MSLHEILDRPRYPDTIKHILFTCLLFGSFSTFVELIDKPKNLNANVA
jgi:hypothetical protein